MWRSLYVFFAILILYGCAEKGPVYRIRKSKNRVAYIIDDEALNLSDRVEKALNDTFYDPLPDPVFDIDGYTPDQFQLDAGYPYVFILAAPQLKSYAFFKIAFKEGKTGFYTGRNVFSQGDFVIGVCAPGPELLGAFLDKYADSIKTALYTAYMESLKKLVYFAGRNNWMRKELERKYGIYLDVPGGWTYIKLKDTIFKFDNVFGIVKHYPERFMMFYNNPEVPYFDADLLIKLRDSLAALYYGGDRIAKSTVKIDSMMFEGRYPALVLTGAWENSREYVGGPFRLIAFNSERGFFMIDMALYAPEKRRKIQYLLRMQIIASTLRFKKEKKE